MSNQEIQQAVREAADRLNKLLEALAMQFAADPSSGVSQQIADAQAQLRLATMSGAPATPPANTVPPPSPELMEATPQGATPQGATPRGAIPQGAMIAGSGNCPEAPSPAVGATW